MLGNIELGFQVSERAVHVKGMRNRGNEARAESEASGSLK